MKEYAELHSHSYYSFKEGVSSVGQLLSQAKSLDYKALALTDHDNLSGAMQFAKVSKGLGIHGIIGSEITFSGGHHLTVLAQNAEGYSNLCRLLSFSHVFASERSNPELDPRLLIENSEGLIVLSGCKNGVIPTLVEEGNSELAYQIASQYIDCLGSENFYIELQQNLVKGDTQRNRKLLELSLRVGAEVVATNNVHYHERKHHQLNDCLVSIRLNKTLDNTHRERRANSEFYLKSPMEMIQLFDGCPNAISNTLIISDRCTFDLIKDLRYRFPDYVPPDGYTPQTYLWKLCYEAAIRRYGVISARIMERLNEEFSLIEKHNLAGFLLYYHDIVVMAHRVMVRLGISDYETPIEERPPGRGRGSSVAMLVGYLIGLSHIDPLEYNLSLERFLPDDLMAIALDIDLDFPRNIRKELILDVLREWGWDKTALVGMKSTYKLKGAVRDLGKVLGLPFVLIDKLAKFADRSSAKHLDIEMSNLPELKGRVSLNGWKDLVRLAPHLEGIPRYIAQHPGGMIIGSPSVIDVVPVQRGAIDGRYICQWDKDDIDDAGFVKIDFLALGALSQLQEILILVEDRLGKTIDISRVDFEDSNVYDMLCSGDTVGIFQVESAAQMQTITRIKPRNLNDMAYEVACVRPGVGVHDGVRHFIRRRNGKEQITFDHPLEVRALERTLGIVLYQDQINQLAIDIGGFSPFEADQLRRSFGVKYDNREVIQSYWYRFKNGAFKKGVDENSALKIFMKFNGYYMFPESHAVAFGVTAYQLAWLKYHHPLEFFTALINQQPMGFWGLETIKENARRHKITILNPDINLSYRKCVIENNSIRLGLLNVLKIGKATSDLIINERNINGLYNSISDFVDRVGLKNNDAKNLIKSGAFESLNKDKRALLWELGLVNKPKFKQPSIRFPLSPNMVSLNLLNDWESMLMEYKTLGIYPKDHLMRMLRPHLPKNFISSYDLESCDDGENITIGGLVARPLQHPLANAYFVSLEDEHGFIPIIIWPSVYEKFRIELRSPIMMVDGIVSRREGTINVVANKVYIPDIIGWFKRETLDYLKLPRPIFR